MRDFLDQKGVCPSKNNFPEPPEEDRVRAYELGLIGSDPDVPRVCLTQTLGGKWNSAVLEILTTGFISAVKDGKHRPVEHTWPQMQEEVVRKRCQRKLYLIQRKCITRRGPAFDKLNRMYSRRQEVCLLLDHCAILTFRRRTLEGERYTRQISKGPEQIMAMTSHGTASGFCLMLLAPGV